MSDTFETWNDFIEEWGDPDGMNIPVSIWVGDNWVSMTYAQPRRPSAYDVTINEIPTTEVLEEFRRKALEVFIKSIGLDGSGGAS